MGRPKVYYSDVIKANCARIIGFVESDYYKVLSESKEKQLIKNNIFKTLYVDPDKKKRDKCEKTGTILAADGIVSARKLYDLFNGENNLRWLNEYKNIRDEKNVIIYWPSHNGGINSCKALVFADRIDYTLYDIMKFFEIISQNKEAETVKKKEIIYSQCKLGSAFIKDITYGWLCKFGGFEDFIMSRKLERFVDMNFDVIDLETGKPISAYKEDKKSYEWGEIYYNKLVELCAPQR